MSIALNLKNEDFPDFTGDRKDRLLRTLNQFGSSVSGALNNGLTFTANFRATVRDISITGGSFPVQFKNDLTGKILGVLILRVVDVTDLGETPVSVGNPAWTTSRDLVVIDNITGLTAGNKYRCTILVLGN